MSMDLEPRVYASIRDIVYRKAGINLGAGKQALVQSRLGKRLRALELPDHKAYLDYLLNDESGEEIVQLLDVISTNHTFFFREQDHFVLLEQTLKGWLGKGLGKLRVWCAAASTGEEPYTLSMVCQDACAGKNVDVRILATDISTRVLKQCKEATYPAEKIQEIPPEMRKRWWEKMPDGSWSASEDLRSVLTFARLNLMEVPYPMKGPFDVIFCRNVMIYFDKSGRERFVREAVRLLRPGGFLVVGHAESLAGIDHGLKTIRPSVFMKPEHP